VTREDVAQVAAVVLAELGTVDRTIRFNNGETPIAEAIQASL
jgi:hypothetical protein